MSIRITEANCSPKIPRSISNFAKWIWCPDEVIVRSFRWNASSGVAFRVGAPLRRSLVGKSTRPRSPEGCDASCRRFPDDDSPPKGTGAAPRAGSTPAFGGLGKTAGLAAIGIARAAPPRGFYGLLLRPWPDSSLGTDAAGQGLDLSPRALPSGPRVCALPGLSLGEVLEGDWGVRSDDVFPGVALVF